MSYNLRKLHLLMYVGSARHRSLFESITLPVMIINTVLYLLKGWCVKYKTVPRVARFSKYACKPYTENHRYKVPTELGVHRLQNVLDHDIYGVD